MPISADRRRARPRTHSGFSRLELMCAIAILAFVVLPVLAQQSEARREAFVAIHMQQAMRLAQDELARRAVEALDRDRTIDVELRFEEDPTYSYALLVENFDLVSGRSLDDQDDETRGAGSFAADYESRFAPGDAGVPEEGEDFDDPHLVRHFRMEVFYPNHDSEEEPSSFVLEGFWPRFFSREAVENTGTDSF